MMYKIANFFYQGICALSIDYASAVARVLFYAFNSVGVLVATPTNSKQIRFRLPVAPVSYHGHAANLTASDYAVLQQCHEGLVRWDAQGALTPGLAEHWSHTDHRRWIFKLRDDLKWSNGQALTAHDVVESWRRSFEQENKMHILLPLSNGERVHAREAATTSLGIRATDPSHVEIELEYPVAASIVLKALTELSFAVIHPNSETAAQHAQKAESFVLPTSGPFYLDSTSKNCCLLKKNRYYYQSDALYFESATYCWPPAWAAVSLRLPAPADTALCDQPAQQFLNGEWDFGYVETYAQRLRQNIYTDIEYHYRTIIFSKRWITQVDSYSLKKVAEWEAIFKPYCHFGPYNRVELFHMKAGSKLHTDLHLRRKIYAAAISQQLHSYGSQKYCCPTNSLLPFFTAAASCPDALADEFFFFGLEPPEISCQVVESQEAGVPLVNPNSHLWLIFRALSQRGGPSMKLFWPAANRNAFASSSYPDLRAETIFLGNLPSTDAYFAWRLSEPGASVTSDCDALLEKLRSPELSEIERHKLHEQLELELNQKSTLWPWFAFAPCYLVATNLQGVHFHHPTGFPMIRDLYFSAAGSE